jgi:hypothetical protein
MSTPATHPELSGGGSSRQASARPSWIDAELIAHTQRVWSPRYGRDISEDEAVAICQDFASLFGAISQRATA